jgi:hypothetical protein
MDRWIAYTAAGCSSDDSVGDSTRARSYEYSDDDEYDDDEGHYHADDGEYFGRTCKTIIGAGISMFIIYITITLATKITSSSAAGLRN